VGAGTYWLAGAMDKRHKRAPHGTHQDRLAARQNENPADIAAGMGQ
jgi:hypothetical protein